MARVTIRIADDVLEAVDYYARKHFRSRGRELERVLRAVYRLPRRLEQGIKPEPALEEEEPEDAGL